MPLSRPNAGDVPNAGNVRALQSLNAVPYNYVGLMKPDFFNSK